MLWAWDWMAMQQQCGMDGNVDSNMDCNVAAMCNVDGNVGGLDGSSAAAGGETWLRSSGDSHGSQIHTHWGRRRVSGYLNLKPALSGARTSIKHRAGATTSMTSKLNPLSPSSLKYSF